MPYFKEKPVFIEARQWDGTLADAQALMEWVGGGLITPEAYDEQGAPAGEVLAFLLPTIQGDCAPTPNHHWIVRLPNGNIEMMIPGLFTKRYEPA